MYNNPYTVAELCLKTDGQSVVQNTIPDTQPLSIDFYDNNTTSWQKYVWVGEEEEETQITNAGTLTHSLNHFAVSLVTLSLHTTLFVGAPRFHPGLNKIHGTFHRIDLSLVNCFTAITTLDSSPVEGVHQLLPSLTQFGWTATICPRTHYTMWTDRKRLMMDDGRE